MISKQIELGIEFLMHNLGLIKKTYKFLNDKIFFYFHTMIVKNQVDINKGSLLLAEPFMDDEFFKRTAILLCNHNNEGSFGYIINKPLKLKVNEVVNNFPPFEAYVNYGGPMDAHTFNYIHTIKNLEESMEICNGIYWSGNYDHLKDLIKFGKVNSSEIMFLLGYAGWSYGQIKEEQKEGTWIVNNEVKKEKIFESNKHDLWKNVLNEMGGEFAIMASYPEDPQLN